MVAFHLVTDLDGTWIPGDGQLPWLRKLEHAFHSGPDRVLSFATGRTHASALEAIERWRLLPPSHLITDVGAALFHRAPGGGWVEDRRWRDHVASRWFQPEAEQFLEECLPLGFRPQAGVRPIRRLALELESPGDLSGASEHLRERCRDLGLRVELLPSHGRYLDVLPVGIHKGAALAFLQGALRLPHPTIGCGDSENDLSLFEAVDLPLLMAGHLTESDLSPSLRERVHRPRSAGPEGIYTALEDFGFLMETDHAH